MVRNCPSGDSGACYQWGVPSTSSSSDNVYFQIEAPSSYSWVGLGLGSRMAGAEMFLVYKDGSGNVTLSTRTTSGEVEPHFVQRGGVELLAGSGIKDGKMVANVKCSGECSKNMDRSGSNNWIAAWLSGGQLQSSSTSADITEHSDHFNFGIDMSKASISADSNPFVGTLADSPSSGGGGGNSNSNSGGSGVTAGSSVSPKILTAHGVVMAVTFAILYPIGAILMPMLGQWLVHGVVQLIAFLLMWAGFGLGYHYSNKRGIFFDDTHMRLGTIVVALLGIQPILGWLHHTAYQRHQRRTFISHIHIWYGRILMALGIINGGLGMKKQNTDSAYKIAYAVVAGVLGGLYIGAAIWGIIKDRRAPRATSKGSGSS
ncbi:hypothetical protein NLU13_3829 [Sarocladium strictum]|uniref:DOMON domain-containing protein n=1 Tax=Sarocladium strictum TaxID=5046 RepID=A0AA39GJ51_SARSR|nr:hypothetical protein NLU13_3829 [Sarocladium strictum]